ncbi:MAG: glycosyltransferase [Propionibacteriaceae bacterium]|nr:glycosyltransferase [Propionibacteriaceae bacterium]
MTIPGISKGKGGYEPRNLAGGTQALINLRSSLLEAALLGFSPDLVIIDRHIYGVWKELREPLLRLRAQNPAARVVLGLREVLDEPEVARAEWEKLGDPGLLRSLVDEVWVYGDPNVHDPIETGEAPPALSDRIRFTGYLATGRRVADHGTDAAPRPFVLTTAGGGSDGHQMLRAAVAMRPPAGHRHIVVTGPQLEDSEFESLAALAGPDTEVHQSWPGLSSQIDDASAVIAMGGYNTVCEILATETPGLIIPREVPRLEQLIRARSLSAVGALDYLRSAEVSADALSAWVADAVTRRVDRTAIVRDGLHTTGHYAADLFEGARLQRQIGGAA